MPSLSTTSRAGSKNDPLRKQRIITATADILRAHGVDGVTFRRIAAEAGVPLGSTTYYFSNKDELLLETVREMRIESEREFRARLAHYVPEVGLSLAVAHLIAEVTTEWRDSFLSGYGVYLTKFSQPNLREEIQRWHTDSLAILHDYFPVEVADPLNFLIEGMLLKSVITDVRFSVSEILPTIQRVVHD